MNTNPSLSITKHRKPQNNKRLYDLKQNNSRRKLVYAKSLGEKRRENHVRTAELREERVVREVTNTDVSVRARSLTV